MQGPGHLSPDSRRLSVASLTFGLATIATLCGCRTTHVVTNDADGNPQYDQLLVVYELVEPTITPASHSQPLDLNEAKSHPLRAVLSSWQASHADNNAAADLQLTIRAPHPDGPADTGLVTLSAPGDEPGTWQTVSEQTMPRSDVDLLFAHLVNGGVCDSQSHLNAGARIAVEVDGHRVDKPWNREPRLDRLAVETYDARL